MRSCDDAWRIDVSGRCRDLRIPILLLHGEQNPGFGLVAAVLAGSMADARRLDASGG
jgi:hypothetical protein